MSDMTSPEHDADRLAPPSAERTVPAAADKLSKNSPATDKATAQLKDAQEKIRLAQEANVRVDKMIAEMDAREAAQAKTHHEAAHHARSHQQTAQNNHDAPIPRVKPHVPGTPATPVAAPAAPVAVTAAPIHTASLNLEAQGGTPAVHVENGTITVGDKSYTLPAGTQVTRLFHTGNIAMIEYTRDGKTNTMPIATASSKPDAMVAQLGIPSNGAPSAVASTASAVPVSATVASVAAAPAAPAVPAPGKEAPASHQTAALDPTVVPTGTQVATVAPAAPAETIQYDLSYADMKYSKENNLLVIHGKRYKIPEDTTITKIGLSSVYDASGTIVIEFQKKGHVADSAVAWMTGDNIEKRHDFSDNAVSKLGATPVDTATITAPAPKTASAH